MISAGIPLLEALEILHKRMEKPGYRTALGGIIACGAVYTIIGAIVQAVGTNWIERVMPPVVTGAVVAVIGLNLASVPIKNMAPTGFDAWMQAVTFLSVGLVAVYTRGMTQRLLIVVGLLLASVVYAVLTNGLGMGKPIDFSRVAGAAWVGTPHFTAPEFCAARSLKVGASCWMVDDSSRFPDGPSSIHPLGQAMVA